MSADRDLQLVYDKQCPVCDLYCSLADVGDGRLLRIDAREDGELMREVTERGLDIDEGMVLKVDGQLYYGAEAIHQLALASPNTGIFNRFTRLMFRSRRIANVLYPVLRALRNLLLRLLGKTRINNLQTPGKTHF